MSESRGEPLVRASSLRIGYGSRVVAECPDFEIFAGDYLCIAGPNGSGKSTLVKTMAGLAAAVGGELSLAPGLASGGIGYVPQSGPSRHDFPASVREVVMSGCQAARGWRPFYLSEERRRAARAMVRLGVASLAKRCYRELSGGQRRRVLLARAICAEPRLLLLDEPAGGLDHEGADALYEALGEANARGVAVVMVTHDLETASVCATRILRLGAEPSFERGPRGA